MKAQHHYLLHILGDIEPELTGPYDDEEERDSEAKRIRKRGGEDGLYPVTLDVELENMCDGITHKLDVDTYSGGFFDE